MTQGTTHPPAAPDDLRRTLAELEAWGHGRGWLGPDPYEGLNATRPKLAKATRLSRRLLVQTVKRSPVDIRRAVGIRHEHNSAGLAHLVSAYSRATFLEAEERDRRLEHWTQALVGNARRTEPDACWSYHFDLETRVFFYPKTTPNTIATAFAGQGLIDAYDVTGDARLLDLASRAGDFFLEHVPQTPADAGAFFGYFVGDRTPIHNASMLVAGLLARLAARNGREAFGSAARDAAEYCISQQRPDGSWPYGERPNLKWVDGFHTGYVLDALMRCHEAGVHPGLEESIDRGLDYYRDRLILPDGTPKYFHDNTYPVDGQCVAQAIQTFAMASARRPDLIETSWRVLGYGLRRMRRSDGAFYFQRRRFWINPAPHVRWVQAPIFNALAYLASVVERGAAPVTAGTD